MTAQDLKNSVLQLAVQGKLIPQNPEDEPAAVLLEKIRAEKKRLVKEGKIKAEKPLPEITEEEIPFEIPESWCWVRLGEICSLNDGEKIDNIRLPYLEAKYLRKQKAADYLCVGKFVSCNTYVILVDGENSGEVFITEEDGIIGSTFKILNIQNYIFKPYIIYLLKYYQSLFKNSKRGAAIPHLDKLLFKNLVIGLPPFNEQQNIVNKTVELLPMIETYGKAEGELTALNSRFPEDLRKSVLQYAVQGKLVEQNPEDEPAAVLLQKIKAEKTRLVKEKKIKADKVSSAIYKGEDGSYYENAGGEIKCIDDEIPFEIPESWMWVRIGDLAKKIGAGSTPTGGKSVYSKSGIKFIRSQNVYNDGLRLENIAYISDAINKAKKGSIVQAKDILLNITGGSIGRCAIVPDDFDIANVNQHVLIIRLVDEHPRKFLHTCLISNYIQKMIMDVQVGVSREGLSATKLMSFLVPFPPLAEQQRIVEKVDELLEFCDRLN